VIAVLVFGVVLVLVIAAIAYDWYERDQDSRAAEQARTMKEALRVMRALNERTAATRTAIHRDLAGEMHDVLDVDPLDDDR
jgi:cytochrome c-type biogenesis protein CcmH/NrfF